MFLKAITANKPTKEINWHHEKYSLNTKEGQKGRKGEENTDATNKKQTAR